MPSTIPDYYSYYDVLDSPAICGVWEISLCTSCPQMAAMAVR